MKDYEKLAIEKGKIILSCETCTNYHKLSNGNVICGVNSQNFLMFGKRNISSCWRMSFEDFQDIFRVSPLGKIIGFKN
jgi:hypothetical protein